MRTLAGYPTCESWGRGGVRDLLSQCSHLGNGLSSCPHSQFGWKEESVRTERNRIIIIITVNFQSGIYFHLFHDIHTPGLTYFYRQGS